MEPIFSRRTPVLVQPEGSANTYTLAPLTFAERASFRAEMTRVAGIMPARGLMRDALRAAVRELSPGNAEELLAEIEAGEAVAEEVARCVRAREPVPPEMAATALRLQTLETAASAHPGYADLLAAQQRYMGMVPFVAARVALRGWEGPGLPAYRRVRGLVPEELLEELPADEVEFVGWRASELMSPSKVAEGNSASPSPSPGAPAPATAASSPTTGAAGS